jgi:hypothetical protein
MSAEAVRSAMEKNMTHIVHEGAFHRLTIAPMMAALENLGRILLKAKAHAVDAGIDPEALLNARLYPDMFSLIQQLQYALFIPADFAQHFAAEPPPKVGYEEKSFAEVHASLGLTTAYLRSIPPARMDERAGLIVPTFFDGTRGLAAESYAAHMIMPDFYFHLTIAYAILRHNGVPLGKSDFIGEVETVPLG